VTEKDAIEIAEQRLALTAMRTVSDMGAPPLTPAMVLTKSLWLAPRFRGRGASSPSHASALPALEVTKDVVEIHRPLLNYRQSGIRRLALEGASAACADAFGGDALGSAAAVAPLRRSLHPLGGHTVR